VAMAFDPNDPDRRREGIIGLSQHDYGLKEPYLEGYATLLRSDRDPLVRAAAVRALGKAQDPNYLPAVTAALSDPSVTVRQDAAAALGSLTGPAATGPLCRAALEDEDKLVRAHCAQALRHYRQQPVYDTLVKCLSDPAFAVRYEAHESLVALGGTDLGYDPRAWSRAGLPAKQAKGEARPWWRWPRAGKSAPAGSQAGSQPANPP